MQQQTPSPRSSMSGSSFPFEADDQAVHPTLLPNGILNDEDDVFLPWPKRINKDDLEKICTIKMRNLPNDMQAREFSTLFTFADGFLDSELTVDDLDVIGFAKFASLDCAERVRTRLSAIRSGPYSSVQIEILTQGPADVVTPPATLSTSSKSTNSNGSANQSRLAQYVNKNDNQSGLDTFYGPPKQHSSSNSINNFSSADTMWSPTSPRFSTNNLLSKNGNISPPKSQSSVPGMPAAMEEEQWTRQTQSLDSISTNAFPQAKTQARFVQLSINTAMAQQTSDQKNGPLLTGVHPASSTPFYPSIENSLHSAPLPLPMSAYNLANPTTAMFRPSGLKSATAPFQPQLPLQLVQPTQQSLNLSAGPPTTPLGAFPNRAGATQVNTNPADQNPPCNTLYVGNLPLATTEEELKSLFSRQQGYRRLCYRTKSNGPMCFVEFEDVSYAINALKLLQGVVLSSSIKGGIRLSFSKNPLGVRGMIGQMGVSHNGLHGVGIPMTSPPMGHFNAALHAPPGLCGPQNTWR